MHYPFFPDSSSAWSCREVLFRLRNTPAFASQSVTHDCRLPPNMDQEPSKTKTCCSTFHPNNQKKDTHFWFFCSHVTRHAAFGSSPTFASSSLWICWSRHATLPLRTFPAERHATQLQNDTDVTGEVGGHRFTLPETNILQVKIWWLEY